MGAYPTDCFYDPGRPSWLPYWLDTPTESQNKIACTLQGTPTTLTPIMWAIPGSQAVGPLITPIVETPTTPVDDSPSLIDQLAAKINPTINLPQIPSWVIYGGAAIGVLMLFNIAKGMR